MFLDISLSIRKSNKIPLNDLKINILIFVRKHFHVLNLLVDALPLAIIDNHFLVTV